MKTSIRIEPPLQKTFLDDLSREYAGHHVKVSLMSSHIVALRDLGEARFIGAWLEEIGAMASIIVMLEMPDFHQLTHTVANFTFLSWQGDTLFIEHPDGSTELIQF